MNLIARLIALLVLLIVVHVRLAAQANPNEGEREVLGPGINTAAVEILPIVSPDGSTLYFDRKYDSNNVGGVDDQDDIWMSTRLPDGSWTKATNLGAPLNTPGSDVLFWISPDGNTALVFHGESDGGKPPGMALSRRRNGQWTHPVALQIDGVTEFGESYYAFVSTDQRHLLLAYAADRSKPRDLDLFVCYAIGDDLIRWGTPVNLGKTLNTPGFEGAPFLASDNRTLYFTSDGHPSVGQADLYVTRRLDTGWTNWSAPKNLGGNINTPEFEASLSIAASGEEIFVSGGSFPNEKSYGRADIFRIPLPKPMRPEPVVVINGRLMAGTRGVAGLVRAERLDNRSEVASTSSDAAGDFHFSLPAGQRYRLTGGAPGYEEGHTDFDARSADGSVQSVVIRLGASRTPAAERPAPGAITFATGSAELGGSAIRALDSALAAINRLSSPDLTILVVGFTDDVGADEDNLALSRRRAEAVRDWLVAHGILSQRLQIEAYGETRPAATNKTADGRALNRRVEVRIPVLPGTEIRPMPEGRR